MSPLWFSILIFAAGALLGGVAGIGWLWSKEFARLAIQRRAARSMGASAWRIFWRVTLPAAWLQIALGVLLVLASAAMVAWAVA